MPGFPGDLHKPSKASKRWRRYGAILSIWLGMLALISGCGAPQAIDANLLADAQVSYDTALEAEKLGDQQEALRLLNQALDPKAGLSPDLAADARILRAVVLARLDRASESHADLDSAAEGAGDLSAVHVARAFVFEKEGKKSEASAEMKKARRLNKSARAIKE